MNKTAITMTLVFAASLFGLQAVAQNPLTETLEKFGQLYGNSSSFQLNLQVSYHYENEEETEIINGEVKSKGDLYFARFDEQEMLVSKDWKFVINHRHQKVDCFANQPNEVNLLSDPRILAEKLEGKQMQLAEMQNGDRLFFQHYEQGAMEYESLLFDASGTLKAVEQHFRTSAQQTLSMVVVTYTTEINVSIPNRLFSETNIVEQKGKEMILTENYQNYALEIHNTSKQ